jgi:uncharacterized protein (TIGR03083 family)
MDLADAYEEVQSRLITTVVALDEHERALQVPACSSWTVADVISHLAGGTVDVTTGHVPELYGMSLLEQWRDSSVAIARDALTAREVRERLGRTLESVVEEWQRATATLFPMLRGQVDYPPDTFPFAGNILINDVVVHEGDIHEALGFDAAPEIDATSVALATYAFSLGHRLRASGLSALGLRYGNKERIAGDGTAAAVVTATRTTLVRMLASRPQAHEIRSLDWEGDPEPYLAVIPEYGPAGARHVED